MSEEIKEILDEEVPILQLSYGNYVSLNKYLRLKDYITNLQQENERLKEQLNQYENPDDMTLFYMWLDTKAKDKMKQFENQIIMLKQQNQIITQLGEDYKSRCEKASDKIQYIIDYGFDYDGFNTVESLKGLIDMLVDYARESKNILQNGSEEK